MKRIQKPKRHHLPGGSGKSFVIFLVLLVLAGVFIPVSGCIGMLKITNNTGGKPSMGSEDRAALLKQMSDQYAQEEQAQAAPVSVSAGSSVQASAGYLTPDALSVGQTYVYGDHDHEIQVKVYNVTLMPFYFWWYIDYNKFVEKMPEDGYQFLVVHLRFENTGSTSALVPSAEMLPVVTKDEIFMHEPYFNTSVLSEYQKREYGGVNEFSKLPYQWIRELGQDQRDYAFLSGYYAIDSGNVTGNSGSDMVTNASNFSYITRCKGSIAVTGDSGKILTQDISGGQCPGYFMKPGASNAIDGYLIYEVPVTIDLKRTYLYGFFNQFSWTRWRLG